MARNIGRVTCNLIGDFLNLLGYGYNATRWYLRGANLVR